MIVFSLPSGGMFILPEREHDGFPVSVPTVSWLPALSELLLAWPCQWSPQQPAPDEGALILGKVAKPPSLTFLHCVLPFPKQSRSQYLCESAERFFFTAYQTIQPNPYISCPLNATQEGFYGVLLI